MAVAVECPRCFVCGKTETLVVPTDSYNRWVGGELVQDAFPTLPGNVRELLVSGTHPACWDELFDVDDDPELREGWYE